MSSVYLAGFKLRDGWVPRPARRGGQGPACDQVADTAVRTNLPRRAGKLKEEEQWVKAPAPFHASASSLGAPC